MFKGIRIFQGARVIRNQNPDLFMASFDIDSLFTNVPLDETIEISVKKLFGRRKKYEGFTREQFKKLLTLAVKNSLFLFNGAYYEQVDGVAMGSPLGPTIANIFLCHWEEIWIKKCPKQFKPEYYNRYMDDTFLLFTSEDHVKNFFRYINSRHKNMSFTFESEHDAIWLFWMYWSLAVRNCSVLHYTGSPLLVAYTPNMSHFCLLLIKRD